MKKCQLQFGGTLVQYNKNKNVYMHAYECNCNFAYSVKLHFSRLLLTNPSNVCVDDFVSEETDLVLTTCYSYLMVPPRVEVINTMTLLVCLRHPSCYI